MPKELGPSGMTTFVTIGFKSYNRTDGILRWNYILHVHWTPHFCFLLSITDEIEGWSVNGEGPREIAEEGWNMYITWPGHHFAEKKKKREDKKLFL